MNVKNKEIMIRYISKRHNHSKTFKFFKEDIDISHTYFYKGEGYLYIVHGIFYSDVIIKKMGYSSNVSEQPKLCHRFKVDYNRQVISDILNKTRIKFRYEHEWREFRKDILFYIFNDMSKDWSTVLPDKIALWASRRLQELKREIDDNCIDNYRVAKVGNTCQERRYRRYEKRGCCGFMDVIDICPVDGKPYRLGFNYGH